MHQDFLGSVLE